MFKNKTRYFYYYQWNLSRHFHFYESVRDVCNENKINLELITFIKLQDYLNNLEIVRNLRKSNSRVFLTFNRNITALLYFSLVVLFHNKTIIHFKQTNPGILLHLKRFFKNRLIFITDLEGDQISEREYVSTIAQNKTNLNKTDKTSINNLKIKERLKLEKFDYTFVYNDFFKKQLNERHPHLKTNILVSHLMSFKKGSLYFNEDLRKEYRNKLTWDNSPIITYIGNVFYPWQNISKTIKTYKRIKAEINLNAKLLLLINHKDHQIAKEFIKKYYLTENDYLLTEVKNKEIVGYLSASDLGIVLRDFHPMNRVVTSGKLLDYLACGLPVITTSVLLNFPNNSKVNEYGLILNDLEIKQIDMIKISEILNRSMDFRKEISIWANENLSLNAMCNQYTELLSSFKK